MDWPYKKEGERLKHLVNDRGLMIKEVAEKAGITTASMHRYFAGKAQPRGEVLASLSEQLGVTTDYLLKGNNDAAFTIEGDTLFDAIHKSLDRKKLTESQTAVLQTILMEEKTITLSMVRAGIATGVIKIDKEHLTAKISGYEYRFVKPLRNDDVVRNIWRSVNKEFFSGNPTNESMYQECYDCLTNVLRN